MPSFKNSSPKRVRLSALEFQEGFSGVRSGVALLMINESGDLEIVVKATAEGRYISLTGNSPGIIKQSATALVRQADDLGALVIVPRIQEWGGLDDSASPGSVFIGANRRIFTPGLDEAGNHTHWINLEVRPGRPGTGAPPRLFAASDLTGLVKIGTIDFDWPEAGAEKVPAIA